MLAEGHYLSFASVMKQSYKNGDCQLCSGIDDACVSVLRICFRFNERCEAFAFTSDNIR